MERGQRARRGDRRALHRSSTSILNPRDSLAQVPSRRLDEHQCVAASFLGAPSFFSECLAVHTEDPADGPHMPGATPLTPKAHPGGTPTLGVARNACTIARPVARISQLGGAGRPWPGSDPRIQAASRMVTQYGRPRLYCSRKQRLDVAAVQAVVLVPDYLRKDAVRDHPGDGQRGDGGAADSSASASDVEPSLSTR